MMFALANMPAVMEVPMVRRALRVIAGLLLGVVPVAAQSGGQLGPGVPEGFAVRSGLKVTLAAVDMAETRFLAADDAGRVYVSQPRQGKILVLENAGAGGQFGPGRVFVEGYPQVHGMQIKDGTLWFTQTGAIHKAKIGEDGKAGPVQTVIPDGQLPKGGGHWWRSILVTDDAIYTSIGDSGNINDERETERQKIWKFDLNGSGKTLFASGLRNTEKLQLRPGTQEVWGCDHGSDWYGRPFGDRDGKQPITDLNPPDELNHYVEGGFYGHPFIVGNRQPRAEFMNKEGIDLADLAAKTTPPAWALGPHVASNGFTFLQTDGVAGKRGDVLVAFHGSWNSSSRVGYCVQRVMFDPESGLPYGAWPLVRTVKDGRVLARPVDVLEMADGSVLFSCDQTRRIYRISKAD